METDQLWEQFKSTGQIKDYLAYKQHSTGEEHHAENNNGAGAAGNKNG